MTHSQLALEGEISRESVRRQMAKGEAPPGDLIPWTMTTQFQVISAIYLGDSFR